MDQGFCGGPRTERGLEGEGVVILTLPEGVGGGTCGAKGLEIFMEGIIIAGQLWQQPSQKADTQSIILIDPASNVFCVVSLALISHTTKRGQARKKDSFKSTGKTN